MNASFVSSHLKIDRANKHIDEIEAAISNFAKTYPDRMIENRDPQTGDLLIEHAADGFRFTLAPIVGDAIHNIRTALDHMWYEFIESRAPQAAGRHTKFPVKETRQGVIAAMGNTEIQSIVGLPDFVTDRIQPYKGGDGSAIWIIHELDIRDKHLLLLPLLDVTAVRYYVEDEFTHVSEEFAVRTGGRAVTNRFSPDSEFKGHVEASLDVVFKNGVPTENEPVIPTLRYFVKTVESVIELFKTF